MKTILCLWQGLGALSLIHRFGFNLFIFQVLDVLKAHSDKARLELSAKGKSTKLNDVLKLYSTINYTEEDNDKKKIEEDIDFNFKNFNILKTLLS